MIIRDINGNTISRDRINGIQIVKNLQVPFDYRKDNTGLIMINYGVHGNEIAFREEGEEALYSYVETYGLEDREHQSYFVDDDHSS